MNTQESSFIKTNRNSLKNMIKLIQIPDPLPLKVSTQHTHFHKSSNPTSIQYINIIPKSNESSFDNIPINVVDLSLFKNAIKDTKNEYIYPTVFVNFAKKYIHSSSHKLLYSNEHLRELQLWGNQYRELINSTDSADINRSNYILYILGIRSIHFLSEDNHCPII